MADEDTMDKALDLFKACDEKPWSKQSLSEANEILLECKGAVNAKAGTTPLMVALMYKNEEIVDLLLDHKADVNVQDELKYTPLHWAIHFGCLEEEVRLKRVEKLLKAGANKNVKNQIGNTPMDYAGSQYNEYKTIMQVLQ